jgi:hypothetical protein
VSDKLTEILDEAKSYNLTDQLFRTGIRSTKKTTDGQDMRLEEQASGLPINPRHRITYKNFTKLVDKNDEHDSKLEILCNKYADVENRINDLESQRKIPVEKTPQIDWRSFAYGVLTLASICFSISRII